MMKCLSDGGDKDEVILIVKAEVKVKVREGGFRSVIGITRNIGDYLLGNAFLLELVSADLHHKTGSEKEAIKGYARKVKTSADVYECKFKIPKDFGELGAVQVQNDHRKEIYVETIQLHGFPTCSVIVVSCNSWVHSKYDNADKRVFFTNKSYLPSETPSGLRRLRKMELQHLRGNGKGERQAFDRIYDYDTYNDLGDPDKDVELDRPVLGGDEYPYPRRCRTGRPPAEKNRLLEQRSSKVYVPRDEAFMELKQVTFVGRTLKSVLHALFPQLEALPSKDQNIGFKQFAEIDSLFHERGTLPESKSNGFNRSTVRMRVKDIIDETKHIFRFENPDMIHRDKFSWFRDEEFSRQTLAGVNPYNIELVKDWPLKSKLDPLIYGAPESLITTELVEKEIKGFMTVNEALEKKRLFMLDYHDLLLPYVNKVREIKGTTLYGSRTLFYLNDDDTLRTVAIELTRPLGGAEEHTQWKQVFTPTWDATGCWLWRLAKVHVCAHDSAYHELVNHWLRSHCATEPYIIAANRQLSAMHPIYRLLHPHFRYTMEINALSRESLVNANGVIESCFSTEKYSMQLSSVAYDQLWRFDMESLPADLIRRGMAVEDHNAEHGLRLTIQDYPFANDGLDLWDAIKKWVSDYVNHYYPESEPSLVECDKELQDWWTEVRTEGHADKKEEPWWPVLATSEILIHVLTTIIWVTSGHHAAVNFGQYTYAGYFPNRPTIARTNMPTDPNYEVDENFLKNPESALLNCFPSKAQATKVMAILDVLSSHSRDEEYIGNKMESSWDENPVIKAAFKRFNENLKKLEDDIDKRNKDEKLKNRYGAGVVPYELLKPISDHGVTGRGVPNSISI